MSDDGRRLRDLRRAKWIARLGVLVIRALASTWRIRLLNRVPVDALRAQGRPVVFAFWHGEMLPLLWLHRNEGAAILISSHTDGEIIASIGHALGFTSVRGSTSRGGARALLGLVRTLEGGRDVAVTPDGPRGPAHEFQPGALVAAQRAGAPVVAIAVRATRAWRLRSWDRFLIPKPFARVSIVYGAPAYVEAPSAREAPAEAPRFEGILAEVGRAAERALGGAVPA